MSDGEKFTSRQVVHYDNSWGLDTKTACGKSLHGWSLYLPQNTTKNVSVVTCKACLKNLR